MAETQSIAPKGDRVGAGAPDRGPRHLGGSDGKRASAEPAISGPVPVPLLVAAAVSAGISCLFEWRFVQVVSRAVPSVPITWSPARLVLVGLLLFLGLGPLFVWIARGGIVRALDRLRADGGRNAKRLLAGIGIGAGGGLAGWGLGIIGALVQDNASDWRYSFVAMAFGVAVGLLCLFHRQVRAEASWGFLVIGLAMGLTYVAIMPIQPNANWDGAIHFNTANAISYGEEAQYDNGDLIALDGRPFIVGGEDGLRIWTDYSIEAADETAEAIDGRQGDGAVYVSEGSLRYESSTWRMQSAVGNLPAGMGLWFGRILGLDNTGEYTTARVFNLLTYVLLWFFGIRRLRSAKVVLAAIALMPTNLYQAANFSYDPWLIAMLGLATCRFIGELQRPEEPLTPKHAAAILVPFALGCLVKAVYFPMALCFFVLRKKGDGDARGRTRYARQWPWRVALVAVAIALFATFAIPFLMKSGQGYSDMRGGEDVDSAAQLQLVLADPMLYGRAALRSGLTIFSPGYLADAAAMIYYVPQSDFEAETGFAYLFILIAAALLARTELDRPYAAYPYRILGVAGVLGAYLLFGASLYIGFTAVGAGEINGFQPKYLVPMLPVLLGVVLDFPGIARRLGPSFRDALPTVYWISTLAYYAIFMALRFVVFFE